MPFWNIRRGVANAQFEGSAAREITPVLEPIQVFTAQRHIEGWIVAAQERVTDLLNQREVIRLCVQPDTDEWATIDRDDILLVAPPGRTTNPQRRVHRQKRRLMALVGSYVVTGVAHLQPGAGLDPYLLRTRQHFLPMTNAVVTHRTDPSVEHQLPVVIVNVGNLTELRALLAPA
jgi:hypothetical protein